MDRSLVDKYQLDLWAATILGDFQISDPPSPAQFFCLNWNEERGAFEITTRDPSDQLERARVELASLMELIDENEPLDVKRRPGYDAMSGIGSERSTGKVPELFMDIIRIPSAVEHFLKSYIANRQFRPEFERSIPEAIGSGRPSNIYLCGAWSSLNAARLAKPLFLNSVPDVPCIVLRPSDLPSLRAKPDDWLIVLSDSGQTGDLLSQLDALLARNIRNLQPPMATVITSVPDGRLIAEMTKWQPKTTTLQLRPEVCDRSSSATGSVLIQVLALGLVATYVARPNKLDLNERLNIFESIPDSLREVRNKIQTIRALAAAVASSMKVSLSDLFSPKVEVYPRNPFVWFVADPSLDGLLAESAAKFSEHGNVAAMVEDSWNIKFGPIALFSDRNKVPVVFLLDGNSDHERRLALSLAQGKNLLRQLRENAFALELAYGQSQSSIGARRIALKDNHHFDFKSGAVQTILLKNGTPIEVAVVSVMSMFLFLYELNRAMGFDPEPSGIPKSHTDLEVIAPRTQDDAPWSTQVELKRTQVELERANAEIARLQDLVAASARSPKESE